MTHRFKRLLEPVHIGQMELKNRIVMLPMENNYAAPGGSVTERLKNYYRARAGIVGLVIIQIACVDSPIGKAYLNQLCIDDDRLIHGLSDLARTIHERGAKAIIQLHHAGANTKNHETVAASPIPIFRDFTPKELTVPEIKAIILRYVSAAQRARKAGFDGIEVVASGNYLIFGFLSSAWNKRQDEYGGDLKGRARILLEIVQAIKESLGKTYPVSCRLALREYGAKGGMTVKEAQQLAQVLQEVGVDGITMTALGDGTTMPSSPGALLPLARASEEGRTCQISQSST